MGPVLAGLHLTSTAAPPAARMGELDCGRPRNPNPTGPPAPVLTMLCGAPVAPGSAALPVARAAPWQSHLMERGGVQDPAEREVGQPLECPGKGREKSAPTRGPPQEVWWCVWWVFVLSHGFHWHRECTWGCIQEGFGFAATSAQQSTSEQGKSRRGSLRIAFPSF